MNYFRAWGILMMLILIIPGCKPEPESGFFQIRVVDEATNRGVPLVCLTTMTRNQYWTDSQGYIAFYEPGLMDKEVYFQVESDGYEIKVKDDGKKSVLLNTNPGDSVTLKIKRTQPAERLYRLTGLGIYRDSELLGKPNPLKNPLLSGGILGQDSQLGARYQNKYFWIWGDSFLPDRYIGNFSVSGAVSEKVENGGLDPEKGIDYEYIRDSLGFSRPMIDANGPGYVWFDWLMTTEKDGEEKLLAKFGRVNGYWQNDERGIAIYNDSLKKFERWVDTPEWKEELTTMGHPFRGLTNGQEYYYMTSEMRYSRVRNRMDSIAKTDSYEYFSCLKEGFKYDASNPQLERDEEGNLVYGWKKNTDAIDYKRQEELIKNNIIKPEEAWLQLRDLTSGNRITVNRGSVFWNNYRQKWILVASGPHLGHVYYAEADSPVGPWTYCLRVATHVNAFYNPKQHPYFDKEDGRVIFFEGTFTKGWDPNSSIVPYYHYNQIMYKLELDRKEVQVPETVYQQDQEYLFGADIQSEEALQPVFYAYQDSQGLESELIPIFRNEENQLSREANGSDPVFYALSPDKEKTPSFGTYGDLYFKGFELFENYIKVEISGEGEDVRFVSTRKNFQFTSQELKGDSVFLELKAFDRAYHLEGKIQRDIIKGRWNGVNSAYKGDWEMSLDIDEWWPAQSPDVIPLYEFSRQGQYEYSTDIQAFPGWSRTDKPICRVWKNYHNQLILDRDIKPVAEE